MSDQPTASERCPFIDDDHGQCGLDAHGGRQVHHRFYTDRSTGKNVSETEFCTVTPAEALENPWVARAIEGRKHDGLGGWVNDPSVTLESFTTWWRSTLIPAPTVLHISTKWHAIMTEDGSLAELLAANPTIVTVSPSPELDDAEHGHALIFAGEHVDVRHALLVFLGPTDAPAVTP